MAVFQVIRCVGKMKKVNIITILDNFNFGTYLQAFATAKTVQDLGYKAEIIAYNRPGTTVWSHYIRSLKTTYNPLKWLARTLYALREASLKKKDLSFVSQYLSSKRYYSFNDLKYDVPIADIYMTGSDQVWTMLLGNAGNNAYFLDFGNSETKRIAYAASFSLPSYPERLMPLLKEQLEKFDAISVREDEGVEICKQAGRNDAVKTLDPTLLLDKDAYLILSNSISTPRNYAFVYSINIRKADEIAWDEICKCADHRCVKLVTTTSSGHFPGREILPNTEYVYATIPEWIAYIHNSEFVATTSFHGVVFCLILNKPFVYFPLGGNGAKGNGRVHSLLSPLGLTNRIYGEKSVEEILRSEINWERVNGLLKINKIDSLKFLDEKLGEQ